jgi:sigma-B regulation protein RsbU (phosphoserine phosphatase)
VTAFYAVLDPHRRTLTYSAAGHNPPRLVRHARVLPLNGAGALPLGIDEDVPFGEATVPLEAGDLLLLYTDGVTEAMAPQQPGTPRELFGVGRLDRVLIDCGGARPAGCIERVRTELDAFADHAPPTDDQTLIAIRCG